MSVASRDLTCLQSARAGNLELVFCYRGGFFCSTCRHCQRRAQSCKNTMDCFLGVGNVKGVWLLVVSCSKLSPLSGSVQSDTRALIPHRHARLNRLVGPPLDSLAGISWTVAVGGCEWGFVCPNEVEGNPTFAVSLCFQP